MATLHGSLVPAGERAATPAAYAGYRVSVVYEHVDSDERALPAQQSVTTDAAGNWRMPLAFDPRGPVQLTAHTPGGVTAGTLNTRDLDARQVIKLTDVPEPVIIPRAADPARGRRLTLTGRALQPDGSGVPARMPVVLWARMEADRPLPVLVGGTGEGGYFSDEWPSGTYLDAWGTVAGGKPIPVALVDGRLPFVVLLVLEELAAPLTEPAAATADHDCGCHVPAPPRTPEQADLVADPEAFSTDLGGGQCVNLTMPNRTLEEVVFHAVVRTTQPEIKGMTLTDAASLPASLAMRLVALSQAAGATEQRAADGRASDGNLPINPQSVVTRSATLKLDAGLAADMLHDGQPGSVPHAAALSLALQDSAVAKVRRIVELARPFLKAGRVTLDRNHLVDWDEDPTIYQASTIAIGHLLTLKQVWRADGYSLGDLLYSLPLAPGQKKQIAIVDWERHDESVRRSRRSESEDLSATLAHDRDISDIMQSALSEHARGKSSAKVSAVGGGIGIAIGPIVLGGGGGHSSASSTAHAHSWRAVTASTLSQARDRTQQAASALRSQRATTVQTTTQGESLRAQSEVVANHNHCHAMSMEYFEVLRHFKVSTELAHVQECLFVPFELGRFTPNKALRWRTPLQAWLQRRDLAGGFNALERIRTGWADADMPAGRYADDPVTYLDGDLTLSFALPRPADDADNHYVAANWAPWVSLFATPVGDLWANYLANVLPSQRDAVWNARLAPMAANALVNSLTLRLRLDDGSYETVSLDPTLVSRFRQDALLEVSLQPDWTMPVTLRSRIRAAELSLGTAVPFTAKVMARSASLYYRTDFISHHLFVDYAIDDELSAGPPVEIGIHLDRIEKRDPRRADRLLAARLVAHLNDKLEFYHQAIWRMMHLNRRYLLLDGVLAPNAGGRSVASVVENRVIGVVGNCLVMPVVPGLHLDPGYKPDALDQSDLLDLYAADAPPPVRISIPTKGVFAEAVNGACSSCEKKDESRFWRWEESPIPETPSPLAAVGTGSRSGPAPDLSPDAFADAIVRYQEIPDSPDPTGLAAALKMIGTPNLFRDLTGLDLNQQAAAAAFGKALETAQFFGSQASNLAQQRYANKSMDRNLERINKAVEDKLITPEQGRDLTEKAITSGTGKGAAQKPAPSVTPAVQKAIDRAASSSDGSVKVSRPSGSVEVTTGSSGPIAFQVSPAVSAVTQPTPNVCWAAGGAMMKAWKTGSPVTVQALADSIGGDWRTLLDADRALTLAQARAFIRAIGMAGESPMCYLPTGLLRLLKTHGPLWVIGDDAVADNKLAHVRVISGMQGDGSADGTQVNFVDPADGAMHQESFTVFARHMEANDASSLGLGIYHY